jgi:hypothetical protein
MAVDRRRVREHQLRKLERRLERAQRDVATLPQQIRALQDTVTASGEPRTRP